MGFLPAILRVLPIVVRVLETAGGFSLLSGGLSARGRADQNLGRGAASDERGAFGHETLRLELERARFEAERRREEETLRLERLRLAAARRFGELRVIAGLAIASWMASALFALLGRSEIRTGARVLLGMGWIALLAALACVLVGNGRITREFATRLEDGSTRLTFTGAAAAFARWWLVAGLALTGASFLF